MGNGDGNDDYYFYGDLILNYEGVICVVYRLICMETDEVISKVRYLSM